MIVGNFKTPLSAVNRENIQKINKEIENIKPSRSNRYTWNTPHKHDTVPRLSKYIQNILQIKPHIRAQNKM